MSDDEQQQEEVKVVDQEVEVQQDMYYIKKWMKFQKKRKQLPQSVPFPQNTQFLMDSQSRMYFIHRIEGFNRPSGSQSELGFIVVANLFISGEEKDKQGQSNGKSRCFFGRTYQSPLINIDFNSDGSYSHHPVYIYFHTKISGQNSPLSLIIEILIIESQNQRKQTLGWIEQCATALTSVPQFSKIRYGSPRILLNNTVGQHEITKYQCKYELLESQQFQQCSFLVPENVLVGYMDEIPGIYDNYLSLMEGPYNEQIQLSESISVYLSQIQVLIPDQLELDVLKAVQKYRAYKFKVSEDLRSDIQISSKRLSAAYHNGWTVVNSRGFNNFIQLSDSKIAQQVIIEGTNKKVQCKQLDFSGVIDINNVTQILQGEDAENFNFGVLILQLEYDISYLVSNVGKQNMQILLGWLPVYLGDISGQQLEKQFDEEFILGPGRTLSGKPLLAFSQDLPITVKGNLNLHSQGGNEKQIFQKPQKKAEQQIKSIPQQQINRFHQNQDSTDLQTQQKILQLQQELKRIQEENENLKKGMHETMGFNNDSLHQQKYGPKKDEDYIREIQQLREENRLQLQTTTKQYEGLEQLILQSKTQQTTNQGRSGNRLDQQNSNILYDRSDLNRYHQLQIEQTSYPLPHSTLKPISKQDTAFLLQTGIPGLLDGDPEDSDLTAAELEERALNVELADDRKDSVIIVQPLAMKIILQDYEISDIQELGYKIPQKLYFTIHFFDLPQYQTQNLILEFSQDLKTQLNNIKNRVPLRILTLKEETTHNFKFTVDTSTIRYNNLHKDFIQYLYRRCLLIDVWDADSNLLFGSMKVPLRGLLRQGKSSQHLLKEIDILDVNFKRIKGSLQILIRNIGKQSNNINPDLISKDARLLSQSTLANDKIKNQEKQNKKKIISEKTVIQNTNFLQEDQGQYEITQEERINQRIRKLKTQNRSAVYDNPNQGLNQKRKLIDVQRYKEERKPQIVKQIVSELLSSHKILNTFTGKADIVPYSFTNPLKKQQIFQVVIDDCDQIYLDSPEFSIISNPLEWQFWCNLKQFSEPYSYDMIKLKNDLGKHVYQFVLEQNESVTILFKFLSYRKVDAEMQFDAGAQERAQKRGNVYIRKYIYPRNIQAYFSSVEGNQIDGFSIQIEPHMQVVDHVLRYYERDNRQTKIILPPLYTFAQPPDNRPRVYITDPNVILEWAKDNKEIKLCLKVGQVCSVAKFNVFVYADEYKGEIIGNWQIEVHSLSGIDIEVPQGQRIASKFTLPCDITRVVRLFTTHPQEIQFHDAYKNQFTLIPGKLNLIDYFVRSVSETPIRAQINCVDFHSQELVHSWYIKINSIQQQPSATYDVKCIEGKENKQILSYVNQTNFTTTFLFTTSHPQYIYIIDDEIKIQPMQYGEIRINVLPKIGISAIETKIFIQDVDERIFDSINVKIKYISH